MNGWVFHFLSSGSKGNCTLVQDGPEQFLIDFGLGPERLVNLLRPAGACVEFRRERPPARPVARAAPHLRSALLTHLHGDHISKSSLQLLRDNGVRLHLHSDHCAKLQDNRYFHDMEGRGLITCYSSHEFAVTARTRALPLRLSHDSPATHGFVLHHRSPCASQLKAGYVADLGRFSPALAKALANCDLLALEFNHDEQMERQCNRPPHTIERVLSDHGHLSNDQAAAALERILAASHERQPRWVVLLHLSEECNRPNLAADAARRVLKSHGCRAEVVVTRNLKPVTPITVLPQPAAGTCAPRRGCGTPVQLSLFDLD